MNQKIIWVWVIVSVLLTLFVLRFTPRLCRRCGGRVWPWSRYVEKDNPFNKGETHFDLHRVCAPQQAYFDRPPEHSGHAST